MTHSISKFLFIASTLFLFGCQTSVEINENTETSQPSDEEVLEAFGIDEVSDMLDAIGSNQDMQLDFEELTSDAEGELKTWTGVSGFTFEYPAYYLADHSGIWTVEEYQKQIEAKNLDEICFMCVPKYSVEQTHYEGGDMWAFIQSKHTIGDMTVEEFNSADNRDYSELEIGENSFHRVYFSEYMDVVAYYIQNGENIAILRVLTSSYDDEDLQTILESVQF